MPSPEFHPVISRFLVAAVACAVLALPAVGLGQQLALDPHHAFPQDLIFTVDLVISCDGLSVKGVETALTFDPAILRLDDVTPGDWFTAGGQAFYFFDYTDLEPEGNIHVASSILDGTLDGGGVFAVLHFSSRSFGTTPVDFVDLDVRDVDNAVLPFAHSVEDSITIDPAVPVEVRPFGRVKALYR